MRGDVWRPRFASIFSQRGLIHDDIDLLAQQAQVTHEQVIALMRGDPITRATAKDILDTFNQHAFNAQRVHLDELNVRLID